jgi:membrane protease YdiL (CAAX protease family)
VHQRREKSAGSLTRPVITRSAPPASASAVLLAIAVVVGQWAARKLGLGTPLIAALLTRRPAPEKTVSTLLIAVALGIVTALALMMLDHWVFAPIPSIAKLIQNAESGSAKPSAWQGLLASFYGALDEEILMRLGLMSLLALAFRTLARIRGSNCELMLPTGVFWAANILAAVLFGLGHCRRPQHLRHCQWHSSYGLLY